MKQVAKTTRNSKANKRKAEREKRRGEIAREALAHEAIVAMHGGTLARVPMEIGAIIAAMPLSWRCTARTLSAALRVARRDGRVVYDGKRYSLPASAPATNAEPPPFSADGPLTRVDEAPVTPTLPSPRADDGGPVVLRWKRDGQFYCGMCGTWAIWDRDASKAIVYDNADVAHATFPTVSAWFAPGEERAEFVPAPKPGAATIVPPAPLPAWVKDGAQVVGMHEFIAYDGILRRFLDEWAVYDPSKEDGRPLWVGTAAALVQEWRGAFKRLDPLVGFPAWCRLGAQPAPGFARDLAEKQAFGFTTARERIASVLTRAGLTEATAAQPGIIVRVERDGRIGLRWGFKHADGSTASCAWTEHAERLMERAANALHNAGYKASVGAPQERAPAPSEAAERVAALEAELATARAEREEAVEREVAAETRRAFAEKHLDRALRILETVVERRAS